MAGGDGVESFLRFGVGVSSDDFADKDDVVTGGCLRIQYAFEVGNGVGQQQRVDLFGRFGWTIELGEFVCFSAGL